MVERKQLSLSIIIPVLHEEKRINATIAEIRALSCEGSEVVEIVVVDGDPKGDTLAAIEDASIVGCIADPGRAVQMNAGANLARGRVFLFLHADTSLPLGALQRIRQVMAHSFAAAGAFDFQFDHDTAGMQLIAWGGRLRSRLERCPYGDQALFFRREVFQSVSGFPEIPIMEDVEIMRRLVKEGHEICILTDRVTTSNRRYRKEGMLFGVLRNFCLRLAHGLGVSPDVLARSYKSHHDATSKDSAS